MFRRDCRGMLHVKQSLEFGSSPIPLSPFLPSAQRRQGFLFNAKMRGRAVLLAPPSPTPIRMFFFASGL